MPDFYIYYQQGTANGPYDVYLSGSSGLTLYGTGITQAQMNAGYVISLPSGFTSSSVVVFDMAYGCATQDIVPFPTPSVSITPSISITPSRTPSVTVTPTRTVTPSVTISVTPSVTPPPSNTPSITPSITPSKTPLISLTPTPSISISRTPSRTPPSSNIFYMGTCSNSYTAAYLACSAYNSCRAYFILPYAGLTTGNTLYDNAACTIPFIGNGNWIALSYNGFGPIVAVRVNSSGIILDYSFTCT
jgi:hypothetical protein